MAGLLHDDRLAFARRMTERVAEKHGDSLLFAGVYGSVARESDTPFSDLKILFVLADGTPVQPRRLIYRGTAVSMNILCEEQLRETLLHPTAEWEFFMGVLDSAKLLHGSRELVKRWIGLGLSVPQARFNVAIEKLWPTLLTEPYGRVLSCIEQHEYSSLRPSIVEVLYDIKTVLCLLNRRWTKHGYFMGLVDTLKFDRKPEGWLEALPFLWNCGDADRALEVMTPLVRSLRDLLLAEGIKLENYTTLDDVEI